MTLASYLEDRSQVVAVGGAVSAARHLAHGVPQGSILGPLLFLVMVNDLRLENKTLLFADDTTLIARGVNADTARQEADQLVLRAGDWFRLNKLQLNEEKTQRLLCTLSGIGDVADLQKRVKLLGFFIDPELCWRDHTDYVCSKLSRVLHLLRKLKSLVSSQYLMTIYYALMHSHINYGLIWWGHSCGSKRILAIQKKAIRLITSSGYRDHCKPLFRRTGIPTIFSQYCLNTLLSINKDIGRFQRRGNVHNHATRRREDIDVPRCRLSRTQNSYPIRAVRLHNMLPDHLKSDGSSKMEAALKEILCDRPLYSLDEIDCSYFL